jgi:SAM-dependent methyltransferase
MSSSRDQIELRPERELVLHCARRSPSAESAQRIRELTQRDLDWLAVIAVAGDHHVSPLLHWNLEAIAPAALPPMWAGFLQRAFRGAVFRNLALSAELVKILDAFEAHGICGLPYKGPVTAMLAYGNVALREFEDLDILVRHRDIANVMQILGQLGYRGQDEAAAPADFAGKVPGQYQFWRDQGRLLVELHTERTLRYIPRPLDMDQLEGRRKPVALGGRAVLTVCPEDMLVMLCVHGAKHFWSRLQWIGDVAEISSADNTVDWDGVWRSAQQMGAARMLRFGLLLAHDLLDAELPRDILRRARTDGQAQRLARAAVEQYYSGGATQPGVCQRMLYRTRMHDGWMAGMGRTMRLAMSPTEDDWAQDKISPRFTLLHAAMRPLHLIQKYGWGWKRRAAPDLAPFVPTPMVIVERMLELAEVKPGDILYDLGCGDGRIVATAAKVYGIHCVGVEIDRRRMAEARARIREAGVEKLVTLRQEDAKTVDLSAANIVTLYLTSHGNLKLWAHLGRELPQGARVVSRDFQMPGWTLERAVKVNAPGAPATTLFLWRVGPDMATGDAEGTHVVATA